ncbi:hypothetical protein A1O3_03100 [Capronia epimyces CBS 606.96]|uniref:Frequency clock protein n=1 Tax=Capronia epimyces CBS 606.96 TaxID=1182542 RepID=W9YB02_9EURO|nr:uncharacterized protein A1O3_03100 [Capronia epimyces CBS 606.96]EXJ90032.1 hypothetical protein A1O3_03100 [Capronia epimyces CBS 606.96]
MVNSPPSSPRSPKRPFAEIRDNSRLTSPSQLRSLARHKRVKIDHSSNDNVSVGGPAQPQPQHQPQPQAVTSSVLPSAGEGESSSDRSGAKWFKRVNENVDGPTKKRGKREGGRSPPSSTLWYANAGLDEAPFYISRQNRYQPSTHLHSVNADSFGPLGRDDTENDELRGVIDDLTVENKRLKNILRTCYNRASSVSSDSDRMIEVRTHGLPPEKKRELERLLKNFATGVNGDAADSQPSDSTPADKSARSSGNGASPAVKLPVADPSHTDSGYASRSNSALHSTPYSGALHDGDSKSKKDSDIKNYLHDIPDSLLPQNTLSVSESTKMQLVVQRLEQLFTGKLAVPGEHSLPIQQQKIARSAAKADRREDEKMNRASRPEGSREAQVLPPDSKINLDAIDQGNAPRLGAPSGFGASPFGTPKSSLDVPGTPDQRPTRPLDLDIHRAQVAAENIRYIQHLGLSSPEFENGPEHPGQPWMYLNLLVSMAQLHTLNVTPAFVRKAVKAGSRKFELSNDGHKIRWKGDSSTSGGDPPQGSPISLTPRNSDDPGDDGAGRRSGRSATSTGNEGASTSLVDERTSREMVSTTSRRQDSTATSSNLAVGKPSTLSKASSFDYRPLVYQEKKIPLKAQKFYLDSSSSGGEVSPDSSRLDHALRRSSRRPSGDGLLTFFRSPHFFVDLSGDSVPDAPRFDLPRWPPGVMGISDKRTRQDDVLRDSSTSYFVRLTEGGQSEEAVACPDLAWSISPISSAGEDETQPIELPASGLGGVRPEDNFALDVEVERAKVDLVDRQTGGMRPPTQYAYRVLQCRKLELQPSRLPPPSYVFFTSSSSSGEQDCLDGYSSSQSSEPDHAPAAPGLLWQWSSSSNEQRPGEEYSGDSTPDVLQGGRARAPNNNGGVVGAHHHDADLMMATQTGATTNDNGSLAATVGATYSAASAAGRNAAREEDEEGTSSIDFE